MKAVIIKATAQSKPGDTIENLTPEEFGVLVADGVAISATEFESRKSQVIQAVDRAKSRGAIAPKDESTTIWATQRLNQGEPVDLICQVIDAKAAGTITATGRSTKYVPENSGRVELVRASLSDSVKGYLDARNPQDQMIRAGDVKGAIALSVQASTIAKNELFSRDGEVYWPDVVKAADVSDPDSQLGTLNTGLVLQRNLGFLKNKLAWLPYLTTDLRNEPAKFRQNIITRYIAPPDVLTFIPGVGYTSDTTTINNNSAHETETSGTQTKSVPSAVDVSVTIDQHKGVEIEIANQRLASTARNLFAEQQAAQFYSLAEAVNKFVLGKIFAPTNPWSGTKTSYTKALANWSLAGMIGVKNALTISKVPDVGRFVLLHSFYHDKLLEDSNLLNAKAILALINKDDSSFNSGELPPLFGVKPLESQLASATSAGVLNTWTDDTNLGTTAMVGFAGNSASMVFAARVPQDYSALANAMGVPATAAIEIVTEPDSGLSMMIVRYVNHAKESISVRAALMYGAAQGDPRVGIVIKPA